MQKTRTWLSTLIKSSIFLTDFCEFGLKSEFNNEMMVQNKNPNNTHIRVYINATSELTSTRGTSTSWSSCSMKFSWKRGFWNKIKSRMQTLDQYFELHFGARSFFFCLIKFHTFYLFIYNYSLPFQGQIWVLLILDAS